MLLASTPFKPPATNVFWLMEFHGLSSEFYSVFWSFDWIPPFPLLKLLCSYYISRVIASFKWCTQNSPKSNISCISSYLFCWEMHGNQRLESPAWAAELTKSIRKQHRISSSWNSGGLTCKVENWKLELRRKTGDKTTIYLNHCRTRPSMQSSTDTKEAPLAQRPKYFQQTLSHQSWA